MPWPPPSTRVGHRPRPSADPRGTNRLQHLGSAGLSSRRSPKASPCLVRCHRDRAATPPLRSSHVERWDRCRRLMADVGAIRELIVTEQARFTVPGLAVVVVHEHDVLLCEGFGQADLEGGQPVTADTHFPIASDTKAFTAATLCLLADAGSLDLDAPVR